MEDTTLISLTSGVCRCPGRGGFFNRVAPAKPGPSRWGRAVIPPPYLGRRSMIGPPPAKDKTMSRLTYHRPHKYNAQKTSVGSIAFDSRAEATRYKQLCLLQKAGVISELELQPTFTLLDAFTDWSGKKHREMKYRADFRYIEEGREIIEDVKGMETKVFKIKQKLFLSRYNLELRIVRP